jgi:hypothetical protein|nr:MAG TPA_asm: helix-turn-helix domain protein [Caudoviricetes sp.]
MKEHNIVYNYGFLADWMKANSSIKRNEILQSMEMVDYNTLRSWVDGVTMLPLTQLMKFCNRFNVPITAFFLDEKADETSIIAPITPNSMIEPAGGWPDSSRKAGIKVCDPRSNIHMITAMPEYIRTMGNDSIREQTADSDSISEKERMRYLDIIEKLNDRVIALSEENIRINNQMDKMKIEQGRNTYGYDMDAEPPVCR